MSQDSQRLQELLEQADQTPYGAGSRALLDEALALALETGDERLEYPVRLRLIADAEMAGDTDAVLSNFAWCAARNDADPLTFPTQIEGNDLLWFYKWIPATLASNPRFSREDIVSALDAMQERYTREGVGLHGVIQARFSQAHRAGDRDGAERWRGELLSTPQDDYSHCEACWRAEQVDYLLGLGREEEALRFFDEIMEQNLDCGEEPESVLATVMVALLRAGRLEEAERAHRLSYRIARNNEALMPVLGKHIEFCAITGNHARALRLLERHLPWLGHDELDVQAHFSTLLSVAVATSILAEAGHGELQVHGSDDKALVPVLGAHDGEYTVAQLAAASMAAAQEIAAAFDARDRSTAHADRVAEARKRMRESHPLPLGETEAPRGHVQASEPAADDVEGWIDAATWAGIAEDADELDRALTRGFAANPTPRQRLRLWGLRAAMRDGAAREEAVAHRVEAYRELGLEEEADFEAAHGTLLAGVIGEDGATAAKELLGEVTSVELKARLRLELGLHYLSTGEPEDAMLHFLEGAEAADAAGDEELLRRCVIGGSWAVPLDEENGELQSRLIGMAEAAGPRANQVYDVLYLRAVEAVSILGQPELAVRYSGEAMDVALLHRAAAPLKQVGRFRADLFTELGRHAAAAGALEALNTGLVELGHTADAGLMVAQGRSLLRAGQEQAALEVLNDATILARDAGQPNVAEQAAAEHWYGEAAEACEYFGTALEAWDRSLEIGEAALAAHPDDELARAAAVEAVQAGRSILMLAGRAEHEEDVHAYTPRVLKLARSLDEIERGLYPLVLQAAGRSLGQVGDAQGVELLNEAEQRGRADGADWFVADVQDTRGRALLALGNVEDALPDLLRAADGYGESGDAQNAALSEYAVGRVLTDLERPEEAASVFESALARVEDEPSDVRSGVAGSYGDLLESLGRTADAARVRAFIS